MSDDHPDWFRTAFGREYLDVYAHRDEEDAERALMFLETQRLIHPADRILDLCCGNGRHSLPLCRRGYRIHGFDLSQDLLHDFHVRGDCRAPLVRGDMRHLSYRDTSFDSVLSLFTSFGYFERDDENWRVVSEVARVLRPGGRFVLDFLNAPRVRSSLEPQTERRANGERQVAETRWIDEIRGRVVKRVEIREAGAAVRRWVESVRLFTRPQIERALMAAGLSDIRAFGDFDSSAHAADSPRLILVACRT